MFIRKGEIRKLGTLTGKPELWFDNGGYKQVDFPVADDIFGKKGGGEQYTANYKVTDLGATEDYDYSYDAQYPTSSGTGFEGSTGRIDLSDLQYGDQLRVRFDFNIIPQIANTTVEPALWYSNRDDSDNITFTFPLTTQPIFYGGGTVGNTYLNRVEISAWITSNEDVNALTLPAIKSDNPVIIQPLGLLTTIIR